MLSIRGQLLQFSYNTSQPPFFFRFLVCSAALVASSNTSRTPSLVRAEHSTYLKIECRHTLKKI